MDEPEKAPTIAEIGAMGGKARAENLTPEERSEIARKAVEARWRKEGKLKEVAQATHGSPDRPLRIGDIEIPCYVLKDGRRVVVQAGMIVALGMSKGGSSHRGGTRLAKFAAGERLKPFAPSNLIERTQEPIKFRTPSGNLAFGFEATVLADLCEAVLAARSAGVLQKQQEHVAKRAEILLRGFARVGIIALVDEATGYQDDRPHLALAKILEAFIAKELRKWVQAFPPDFYKEMFRLRNIPYTGKVQRPAYIGRLTNDLVYVRLAPGVLTKLREKNPVIESGRRRHKHHQWLTENVGLPELKEHLKAVVALMRAFDDWGSFYRALQRSLPKQIQMPLLEWSERQKEAENEVLPS
jgi:hypothetical protein